ncbi:M20 aminoacylase family protein [Limoniibacter endophyticus]|uniref:Amidohydrolase n=1 Tax=Limoniibacter endophyticus TaxID=1565040 RepID=A0A8J3DKF7_9HYPH|nr:M20 aminoacylase family protein [Limoniibacter endophyticus]GHC64714.1 amidohydrolase [Limoniibacter endophyticus]
MTLSALPLADIAAEAKEWRRDIHANPELLFDLPRTASLVAENLKAFGCDEVATGVATSGVVGVVRGRGGAGKTIALRCDMDALPIHEQTNLPYASKRPGFMHACGHDGHTAILLGAAKALTASRAFSGTVVLVFQPAEEGGAGSRVMLEEGLLERFGIEEVYGMHNLPGLDVGSFSIRPGALMAAADRFVVTVDGKGGHAAFPHLCVDPVLISSEITVAAQSIASRLVDPLDSAVLSITYFETGGENALNVIPATARFGGTLRTLSPRTRKDAEQRFRDIVEKTAAMHGARATVDWRPGYPVTINDPEKTKVASAAAARIATDGTIGECPPMMGAEDFSFMLEKRPGAMIWLGNGPSADLHNPGYDFNDDAILPGISYWLSLVAQEMKPAA